MANELESLEADCLVKRKNLVRPRVVRPTAAAANDDRKGSQVEFVDFIFPLAG